jgi:hypothetical protein
MTTSRAQIHFHYTESNHTSWEDASANNGANLTSLSYIAVLNLDVSGSNNLSYTITALDDATTYYVWAQAEDPTSNVSVENLGSLTTTYATILVFVDAFNVE